MDKNYFTFVRRHCRLKGETDSFLKKLPERRTKILCKAIDEAEAGNCRFLRLARAQRAAAAPFRTDVPLKISDLKISTQPGKTGVRVRVYEPESGKSGKALLYMHGGGWTIGGVESCQRFCADCAAGGNCTVISIDYSLAPEAKFPIPVMECSEVFEYVSKNAALFGISEEKITLAGDSAGGNIALAAAIRLLERKKTQPCALVLFYPVTTLVPKRNEGSWKKFGRGFALDSELMDAFSRAYLEKPSQAFSQYASPLMYDRLGELPPTLLIASGKDILHDQSESLAKSMSAAGAKIRYVDIREATHIYITMEGMEKSYSTALRETLSFLEKF